MSSNQTGAKDKTKFSWKEMLKTYPYFILSVLILVSVVFFGILIRNLERCRLDRNGKFDYVWDALWLVITIMLTIGYGDITIDTNFGRLVGIVTAFWGYLVYSLFVLSMNVLTMQDEYDSKAYKEFQKLDRLKILKKSAGFTIGHFILFNHFLKKKQKLIDHTKTHTFRK